MGTWGKLALGENEYLGQMGTRAKGHFWGIINIWGKGIGYPKFPKRVPQVPCVHFRKCLRIGTGANGHLDVWGKGIP